MDAVESHNRIDPLPWRVSNDLAAWYLVAGSDELPEGAVRPARVGRHEIVLFRDQGRVYALDPYCAHMGARLCQGGVHNGLLTCPLHGWQYRGDGSVAGGTQRVRSWPVEERMGGILVFNGIKALYEPPCEPPGYHWSGATSELLDSPWFALTANAFDTHHYQVVHRRRLKEPAVVLEPDRWTFSCSYLSEVTGGQLSDRLMRRLAPDGIRVTMTCYGGVLFLVNSVVGSRRASLLVGMEPEGDRTRLRLQIGSTGKGLQSVLARYLYTAFLKSDLKPMAGVRLQPFTGLPVDATIERFARYLEGLPTAP
ncbi:MAG: Rieske 2Fe-2S domain-containing protein [Vulcanimicrobiota bacterium]